MIDQKFSLEQRSRHASWLLAAVAMLATIQFHLLPALLAGLLAFELVRLSASRLQRHFASPRSKLMVVATLATMVVAALALGVMGAIVFFRSDAGSLHDLLSHMAKVVEDTRATLPPWIAGNLPATADDMQGVLVDWLRGHAAELRSFGKEAGVSAARLLIGLVIGALIAMQEVGAGGTAGPLGTALTERVRRLADAFRRVVFAQLRISAVNTALTAVYLVIVLPLAGISLPLTKTMIALALITGMLPVVTLDRGRNVGCPPPPAQIRTGPIRAYGSYLG